MTFFLSQDTRQPGGAQMHYSSSSSNVGYQIRRPKIVCHSELTATRICEHINYAKILSAGQSETLPPNDDDIENDKTFDLEVWIFVHCIFNCHVSLENDIGDINLHIGKLCTPTCSYRPNTKSSGSYVQWFIVSVYIKYLCLSVYQLCQMIAQHS